MKKLLAMLLMFVLTAGMVLPAYATTGFDLSVFDNAEDVIVDIDDIEDTVTVVSKSALQSRGIRLDSKSRISIVPIIASRKECATYCMYFLYYADDWEFIDRIIIKVGEKRFNFDDVKLSREVEKNATIQETAVILIDSKSFSFMQYLLEHRDEKVMIRLKGDSNIDFELPKETLDNVIHLYNLYAAAGGTQIANLKNVPSYNTMKIS